MRENGEKSKRIFLYSFVIADDFEIPVYSMLSEVHTMSHVTHWFNEFIRLYKDIPNEFVCDMSTVLLNAAAKSFAVCADINDYVDWLFNLIKHSNNNGRNFFGCVRRYKYACVYYLVILIILKTYSQQIRNQRGNK